MAGQEFDSVELEIAWGQLISIIDEAAVALVRTSFSTIVREAKDYTVVLLDRAGRSVAQPTNSAPPFNGTMPRTMRHFIERFPLEEWSPGDVVITNDPWMGTGHLNDANVARPIFLNDDLIGFAGVVAHTVDMGGIIWSASAQELFEEGLQIPVCRLFAAGEPNEDVINFIRKNVRMPDIVVGDLLAMIAAAKVVERRLGEFLTEFGAHRWDPLAEEIIRRSEAAMRAEIRKLPDGTYSHEISLDGYREPLRIRAAVTVLDGSISVDYAGTSAQVPIGINSPYCYSYAYTCYPLKCLCNAAIPNNEGCFRPFEVIAPEGCLINPLYPAAVAARPLSGHPLYAVLFGALASVVPDRVIAESAAPRPTVILSGYRENGQRFHNMFFIMGGLGARAGSDGVACLPFPTNVAATPVEIMESTAPILIERKEIVADSGGSGRFRGGCAQEVVIRNLSPNEMRLSIMAERTIEPPQGLFGGQPGGRPSFHLDDGTPANPKGISSVAPAQAMTIRTHGGGGYGPPGERAREAVYEDIQDGYVTPETAKREYGVDDPPESLPQSPATGTTRGRVR